MAVPDDLGQAEVSNLDNANATGSNALDKLALIGFVLVVWRPGLWVPGGNEGCGVKEKVLRLDVTI